MKKERRRSFFIYVPIQILFLMVKKQAIEVQ